MEKLEFTPLIIIGAGRSGTNILRDTLTKLPDFRTWPCDEINPIWRHGNLNYPSDEIPVENAAPAVISSIRKAFIRIWRSSGQPHYVVEKTCANSLRVDFVDTVLPEARYIHILRDGMDVVSSARKRWNGEMEVASFNYFLTKARYSPLFDLPVYAFTALKNRLSVKLGLSRHLETWGPKFEGMDNCQEATVEELAARQWAACVNASAKSFAKMPESKVIFVRYEDLATNPVGVIANITDWLGIKYTSSQISAATSDVRRESVGKGQKLVDELPEDVIEILNSVKLSKGQINQ